MTPDPAESRYHERADADCEFDRSELKRLRFLLRRLRFMEAKIKADGQNANSVFFEQEIESLEFVLGEAGVGYLDALPT